MFPSSSTIITLLIVDVTDRSNLYSGFKISFVNVYGPECIIFTDGSSQTLLSYKTLSIYIFSPHYPQSKIWDSVNPVIHSWPKLISDYDLLTFKVIWFSLD
jgi:hypothetical protein